MRFFHISTSLSLLFGVALNAVCACSSSDGILPLPIIVDGGRNDASLGIDAAKDDAAASCLAAAPVEGSACTLGATVCASGNACCLGYEWTCDSATLTWKQVSLGCPCTLDAGGSHSGDAASDAEDASHADTPDAASAKCGTTTCRAGEYCTEAGGGAPPPDGGNNTTYTCKSLPSACVATPTCACLQSDSGNPGCTCDDTQRHPYVRCQYP
jgi:hypothetical protein